MSNDIEVAQVYVFGASKFGKKGWFEGNVVAFEGDKMIRFPIDFPIDEMRDLGVCKTLGSWKKIREWANSDAGNEYVLKNRGRDYGKQVIGM